MTDCRRPPFRLAIGPLWIALTLLGTSGCGDDGDRAKDVAGMCAVVKGRDLADILDDTLATGGVTAVSTPAATLDQASAESLSRSFAAMIAEDSPGAVSDDAETYAAALERAIDGDQLSPQARDQAVAAGERFSAYLDDNCPTTG